MSCKTPARLVSKIWDQADTLFEKYGDSVVVAAAGSIPQTQAAILALKAAHKTGEAIDEAIRKWNDLVGNSWAKIGPRALTFDETLRGTLTSATTRTFITPFPCVEDEVSLNIRERGGSAKTEICICRIDSDGDEDQVARFVWNENRSERKQKSQRIRYRVRGVEGHLLVVTLKSSSVLKKLEYSIEAEVED